MLKASLRSVVAHKIRLALSAIAVVLGVAFVAGSLVFTDTISTAFDKLFDEVSADVTVSKELAFDAQVPGQEIGATTVPASLLPAISAVPGVKHAEGDITVEGIRILGKDGKVLGSQGAPGLAIDWPQDLNADSSVTLVEGKGPAGPDDVVVDSVSAAKGGLKIGDKIVLLTPGPRLEATLTGIFKFGDTGNLGGATLSGFTDARAHDLLGSPDFSEIVIKAADGQALPELRDRITKVIPADYVAKTRQEQAETNAADIKEGLAFLNIFLLIFAGVAVFVGSFIILNTFTMLVAQRTRELALMRALGANRRQVTSSVLVEALVVGLIGSTLGLAAGLGIATGLRELFAAIGLDLGSQGLVVTPRTIATAYLVGVPVTLVAAYFPARRAARIPPVAAMRDDVAMPERSLRIRAIAGTVLFLAGAGLMAAGLLGSGSGAALGVGLGVVGVFVGVTVVSPILSKPFVRTLGAAFPVLFGAVGRLSRENALRNPRRTAATASALMIGLALVGTFGVMSASINASIGKLVDSSLEAEFILSDAAGTPFSPQIAQDMRKVPGVASVMEMRATAVQVDGKVRSVAAISPEALTGAVAVEFRSGDVGGLHGRSLLVDDDVAASRGWSVGDRVPRDLRERQGHEGPDRRRLRRELAARRLPDVDRDGGSRRGPAGRHLRVRQPGAGRVGPRPSGPALDSAADRAPRGRAEGPGRVQGRTARPGRPAAVHDLRHARAGHRHRRARHHQHPRPVGDRTDPGDRAPAGGRHEPASAAPDGAAGIRGDLGLRRHAGTDHRHRLRCRAAAHARGRRHRHPRRPRRADGDLRRGGGHRGGAGGRVAGAAGRAPRRPEGDQRAVIGEGVAWRHSDRHEATTPR